MRISDMRRGLLVLLVVAGAALWGVDGVGAATTAPAALSTPDDYARAEIALRDGHVEAGLAALKSAAQRGGVRAGLRLAKIYAEGKIVGRDDAKACELYGTLADRHWQIDRTDPAAMLIAEAFRLWAFCYMKGTIVAGAERSPGKAAELFYYSGVILDDAESLYELARMYLKGEGVAPNPRLGVHYLFSASRKRYAPAQALLGSLMWEGKMLKQQRVNGLALIKFALETAKPEEKVWIDRQHEEAMLTAGKDEEAEANRLVQEWKKAYGPDSTGTTSPLIVPTPPAATPPVPLPPPAVAGTPGTQVPAPVRNPNLPQPAPRQVATPSVPGGLKPIEQQNTFSTQPTGANLPAATPAPTD